MKRTNISHIVWSMIILILAFYSCKQEPVHTPKVIDTGDIIGQIEAMIATNPNDPELYFKKAEALYEKDEYEAAITDLNKAISLDSLRPDYYHLLADNYLDYYKSREALNVMEKVARMFPERIPTLLKLSEMQHILMQYENSTFTINEILRLSPREKEAFFMLGLNFQATKDYERAINSFQTAVEIDPELVDAWIILGEIHEQMGNKIALKYFENAVNVDPENPQALHAKAFYLQNNDRIPDAIEVYKEIILSKPQYDAAYLNTGILYLELDSFDKAYEQFELLSGISPQNHLAYYYKGVMKLGEGKLQEAQLNFQNCLNFSPDFERAKEGLEEVNKELAKVQN